jgi:PAP2 superfamily
LSANRGALETGGSDVWLPWRYALIIAVPLLVATLAARPSALLGKRWARLAHPFLTELTVMFVLYAMWQRVGEISLFDTGGAMRRGKQIWDLERLLHIGNEASIERFALKSSGLIQSMNVYYAAAHVAIMLVALVWLFVRHRDRYPQFRTVLALATGASLLIQLVPVAPPRMYPELGFVDAAELYGQSVYGALGRGDAGQLAAMPSVHVAWCLLIAWGVWTATRSRWRWLGIAHAIITVFAVVSTANHWWLDGIAAVPILLLAGQLDSGVRHFLRRRSVPATNPAEQVDAGQAVSTMSTG